MIRAFHTGASGMQAQSFNVDSIANNLANVNTTGFKRNMVAFQDLIYQTIRPPGIEVLQGVNVPSGLQVGNGVRVAANNKIFTQGTLENTLNPLDVAIEGEGFFQITFPDGTLRYTRDGGFQLNSTGQIVTADGFPLSPAITVPADTVSIAIGSDGTVSVITGAAPTTSTVVGQITLARFANPAGLFAEGRNLFRESPASGTPVTGVPGLAGNGLLRQGFLERSNVEVVQELVNLLLAQRAFEFNSRSVRVADEMLADTAQLVVR
jgi:flagellar basal-body rod protein FlgG